MQMPEKWATCSYDDDSDCGDYYTGEKWWIAVSGLTGLGVGIFRWATNYPHDLAGLFQEINEMHVDWRWTPHTFLISMASLCGGATLGPEQALVRTDFHGQVGEGEQEEGKSRNMEYDLIMY